MFAHVLFRLVVWLLRVSLSAVNDWLHYLPSYYDITRTIVFVSRYMCGSWRCTYSAVLYQLIYESLSLSDSWIYHVLCRLKAHRLLEEYLVTDSQWGVRRCALHNSRLVDWLAIGPLTFLGSKSTTTYMTRVATHSNWELSSLWLSGLSLSLPFIHQLDLWCWLLISKMRNYF